MIHEIFITYIVAQWFSFYKYLNYSCLKIPNSKSQFMIIWYVCKVNLRLTNIFMNANRRSDSKMEMKFSKSLPTSKSRFYLKCSFSTLLIPMTSPVGKACRNWMKSALMFMSKLERTLIFANKYPLTFG